MEIIILLQQNWPDVLVEIWLYLPEYFQLAAGRTGS